MIVGIVGLIYDDVSRKGNNRRQETRWREKRSMDGWMDATIRKVAVRSIARDTTIFSDEYWYTERNTVVHVNSY